MANKSKQGGKKHAEPAPAPTLDEAVVQSRAQAALVHTHLAESRRQRAALLAAKHAADPTKIRVAAADLERTGLLLQVAAAVIEDGAFHRGGDAKDLVDAQAAATLVAEEIGREVTKARGQADRLEQAAQGALAQVTEETSTMMEPEETRRRAERQAPPGLCDDEELQHPASYACPLDIPQRAILRERVANKITTLAQDWKDAIRSCELDDRFAALNTGEVHPLVGVLVDLVTGFAASRVTAAVSLAIEIGHGVARSQSAQNATSSYVSQAVGVGKKLADYALNNESKGSPPDAEAFFRMADAIARRWRDNAMTDIRQLPDPALVLVDEELAKGAYDRSYFDSKIRALLAAFKPVASLGEVDYQTRTLELAYITSARHPARLALVKRRSWSTEAGTFTTATNVIQRLRQGEDLYDFDQWVDRSMYKVALAHTPEPPTLHDTDARWVAPPTGHWLQPEAGTTMLGVTNREEPS